MHRIDSGTAAPGGLFTSGDPNVGVPATVVTPEWLNAVQTEVENVVTGTGAGLNKADNTQLLKAIRALISSAVPPGMVAPFARATAPAGWLVCDGSAVSRAAYPVLFAALGTLYGAGDGSTTFGLPDLRGEFVRGADGGRGVDAGRAVGSWQDWATGRPKTTTPGHVLGDGSVSSTLDTAGGGALGSPHPSAVGFARATRTGEANTVTSQDSTYSGREMDVFNVVAGDAETRPRNVAQLLCIKV